MSPRGPAPAGASSPRAAARASEDLPARPRGTSTRVRRRGARLPLLQRVFNIAEPAPPKPGHGGVKLIEALSNVIGEEGIGEVVFLSGPPTIAKYTPNFFTILVSIIN